VLARETRKLQEAAEGANELSEHEGVFPSNRNMRIDSRLGLFGC
jgi:hypothetical protein